MTRQQRKASDQAGVPLLKTCQTCFKAKIRCESTKQSGSCDRCLRLHKACFFAPSKRQITTHSRTRGDSQASSSTAPARPPASPLADLPLNPSPSDSYDPISLGLIDFARSEHLVALYNYTMAARFPFVIVPRALAGPELRRDMSFLFLAVVAVASHDDFIVQRQLSNLFNQALSKTLASGKLASLDALQGILVHLAWAHYQNRSRSYSQQMYLAASIVSDMRLDRPKRPQLWKVAGRDVEAATIDGGRGVEWRPEELRALIGTYYLASSSSIVMQKMRHFPVTPFILDSCNRLERECQFPSDQYLSPIVQLQQLTEEVDDIVNQICQASDPGRSKDEATAKLAKTRRDIDYLKSGLTFPLSDCPTLLLQLGLIELLISQQFLPWSPLAPSISQDIQFKGPEIVVASFSDTVLAAKSLVHSLTIMVPGQEKMLTNMEWLVLNYALSISVRLDVLAADSRIAHLTKDLRRSLDIRHLLRQITLKVQGMISPESDAKGDRDTWYQFVQRGEAVMAWYIRQTGGSPLLTPRNSVATTCLDRDGSGEASSSAATAASVPLQHQGEIAMFETYDFNDESIMDMFMEEMQGLEHWQLPSFLDDL